MSNSSERSKPLGFDLRTRIAAVLAAEFDGQARKFDDAGWEGVAIAVIRELQLTVLGDGIVVGVIHE